MCAWGFEGAVSLLLGGMTVRSGRGCLLLSTEDSCGCPVPFVLPRSDVIVFLNFGVSGCMRYLFEADFSRGSKTWCLVGVKAGIPGMHLPFVAPR